MRKERNGGFGLTWYAADRYRQQPDFPVLFLATRNESYAREVERHFSESTRCRLGCWHVYAGTATVVPDLAALTLVHVLKYTQVSRAIWCAPPALSRGWPR